MWFFSKIMTQSIFYFYPFTPPSMSLSPCFFVSCTPFTTSTNSIPFPFSTSIFITTSVPFSPSVSASILTSTSFTTLISTPLFSFPLFLFPLYPSLSPPLHFPPHPLSPPTPSPTCALLPFPSSTLQSASSKPPSFWCSFAPLWPP